MHWKFLWLLLSIAALGGVGGTSLTSAATPSPTPPSSSKSWEYTVALEPRLALSDSQDLPVGAGISLQGVMFPLQRFGFGIAASWSRHAKDDFLRAEILLHVLIDDLVIHPFLQSGIGVQLRISSLGVLVTPDISLALGFDVPLNRWFAVGAAFRLLFPIDPTAFPITKSLHLRLRLLF